MHTPSNDKDGAPRCGVKMVCRCCGKGVHYSDREPIHTACIAKHWGKHAQKINASRCYEFGKVK